MENNEIKNEEAMETENDSKKGSGAVGVMVATLAVGLVCKFIVKPAAKRIKNRKMITVPKATEAEDVDIPEEVDEETE